MQLLPLFFSLSASITSRHNFGPVSTRDDILYTACRPGNSPTKTQDVISNDAVREWIDFMKSNGVHKVISLLDANEYGLYETDLCQQYTDGGLACLCQEMKQNGACTNIFEFIDQAAAKGEKVVVHCTGGIGRAGRVAGGWLVHRYGLTPVEATDETLSVATEAQVIRKGDVNALSKWLGNSKLHP